MHVLGASLCPVAFAMQVNKPVVDLSNKTESLSQIRTFILLRFPKKEGNNRLTGSTSCVREFPHFKILKSVDRIS